MLQWVVFNHLLTIELILWLASAMFGLRYAIRSAHQAMGDLDFIERNQTNGARMVIAKGNLRREIVRILIFLLFIFLGVYGFLISPSVEVPRTLFGVVFSAVFITTSILLTYLSLRDDMDRRYVVKLIKQEISDLTNR